MVECGFNFFIDHECCGDMFAFRVSGCDDFDDSERCVMILEWVR